jgi:hypothetical protein
MKSITLSNREIKERIAYQLRKYLEVDGFTYKKSGNEYRSIKGDFVYIFNLLLTSWSDHYSLSVRLFISNKKIEKIYELILGESCRLTMGNTIERIAKSADGKEIVNADMAILLLTDDDIEAAVETLARYYNDIAKPYYERYQSLHALDTIINNPPFEHCPADVGGNFDDRCIKGLIIAKLVHNTKYEQLITVYNEAIKETMNNKSIENYCKVKDYLMYNRVE